MARLGKDKARQKKVADDLEPYRRLVELQKQMIALAQQHELTKRRRDALHEQMAREVENRKQHRRGWRHRLRESAATIWKRVPRSRAGKPAVGRFQNKAS